MNEEELNRLHEAVTRGLLKQIETDPVTCAPSLYQQAIAHLKNNGISIDAVNGAQPGDGAFGSLINTVEQAVHAGSFDDKLLN